MRKITDIQLTKNNEGLTIPAAYMTGREDFDKWFSRFGGIVLGSAIYVTGTSGGGKSTLMMNITSWLKDEVAFFYSREMLSEHLKAQLCDLEYSKNCYISDVEDNPTFESFMKEVNEIKPKVLIVDSLQVIAKEDYVMTGKMGEDAACYIIIKELRDYICKNNAILFLIGHNTKDGVFAGANTNMQMIDAHIDIVYDRNSNTRTMNWGMKNRKGPMGSPLQFYIENSNIVFESNETTPKEENNYSAYNEAITTLEKILCEETILRKATAEQKKEFKSRIEKAKKEINKKELSGTRKLTENIYEWIKLAERLDYNML